MDDTNRPPLWEVMHDASLLDPFATSREIYAAEIRALRDWLLPEEDPEPQEPPGYGIGCCCEEFAVEWAKWYERQRLRALLAAELDTL